jgi:hypothetical protein
MSSFLFFVFLTIVVAFFMNWVYISYIHTCPLAEKISRQKALDDMERRAGTTTLAGDIESYLDDM